MLGLIPTALNQTRRLSLLFAHDLVRKPVPTFRDHALTCTMSHVKPAAEPPIPRSARLAAALRATLRFAADVGLPPLCPACRQLIGDNRRPVRRVLVRPLLHRAALLRAARHPVRLRSGPRHPVDAGDRRPARLSAGARGGALRRGVAQARACAEIRRPARPRADARALDGGRRPRACRRRRRAGSRAAALAPAVDAAVQPIGGARQGDRGRDRRAGRPCGAQARQGDGPSRSACRNPSARSTSRARSACRTRARSRSPGAA